MIFAGFILGQAFAAFGVAHWLAMLAIATTTALLVLVLRRMAGSPRWRLVRRCVCWSLAGLLIAGAADGVVHRLMTGTWSLRESLPLHLCDLAIFVTVAALLGAGLKDSPQGAWQRFYELAYVWAVGGTSQAVLTPDMAESFPSPACLRYFVIHGAIIVAVLAMTLGLRMRPQPGTVRRVWLTTLAVALLVLLVDWAVDANYMYLRRPPAHPSLFDLFGAWPWSLLSLVGVGTLFILLCYAPFWLHDRWRLRRWHSPTPG